MDIVLHPRRHALRMQGLRDVAQRTAVLAYRLNERLAASLPDVVPTTHPDAQYAPVEVLDVPAPRATVFAFASMRDSVGMPVAEFKTKLSGQSVSVVFMKDFARLWYANGLLGRTENRRETVAFLKREFGDATRPWIFTGASAGGHAAIHFGCELGADHIVAFSPRTFFETDFTLERHAATHPVKDFDHSDPDNDLAVVLRRHPQHARIDIHYAADNRDDRVWARHIEGFPGVTTIPHPSDKHGVASFINRSGGDLASLILASLDGTGVQKGRAPRDKHDKGATARVKVA